jgi:predicted MFS family arabinose efflux permease
VLERNRGGSYLTTLLVGIGMMGTFLFLTYYLQQTLHYSALKTGFAYLPFSLGIVTGAAIASRFATRVQPRIVMGIGLAMAAAGMLWFTQLDLNSAFWPHVFPAEIVMSLGMGLVFVTVNSTALAGVQPSDSGVASALINASQQVGGSIGTALLNTIAATATATYVRGHAAGTQTLALGTVHGYSVAFAVAAGVLGLALLTVLLLVNVGPTPSGPAPEGADGVISEEAAAALAPMLA